MISVDKAIEYLEQIKKEQPMSHPKLRNNYVHQTGIDNTIDLLKSLATRCMDYDALLDELKKELLSWGTPTLKAVYDNLGRLEKKYLGGKND